jgi:type VI secretion system protein VasG
VFKPAFLGRVTIVPYFALSEEIIRSIVELQLGRIVDRVAENYQATLDYSAELVDAIAGRCQESESGARNVEQILAHGLLPELSARLLERMAAGEPVRQIHVAVDDLGTPLCSLV